MKRRRVKITGIGPVTPAGIGREAFWKGILEPVSRVRPFTRIDPEFGSFVAACVDRFDLGKILDRSRHPKGAARHTQFAIAGAVLAMQDAGIGIDEVRRNNVAVITGSCLMDFGGIVGTVDGVREKGSKGAQARTIFTTGVGCVPSAVNEALGICGRTVALSNQCSSGMDAVGYAASLIAGGEIEVAICGGTDSPLHRTPMVEFQASRLIAATMDRPQGQSRPFDLWRVAGVLAEGCAMFVLEAEESERAGYSFVEGYGFANDVGADLCGGMVEATRLSLGQARVHQSDIEVMSAWGPGDPRIDAGEVRAMRRIFGEHLDRVAVASIKGAIGSPLGGAPAIQIAAAALGQKFGIVPPTVNWDFPDPDCRLNLSRHARAISHDLTLLNSHGLGAVNGSMVLRRCT